jgi:hypothetical protein
MKGRRRRFGSRELDVGVVPEENQAAHRPIIGIFGFVQDP